MSFFKKLFGLDRPTPHNPETTALLTTVYSNEELVSVRSLLDGMNIPYNWADRGAGGVTRIIVGNTSYGTDVFVRPDHLEDARALLFPELSSEELAAMSEDAADQSVTEDTCEDREA
jgi:hypothetical protein